MEEEKIENNEENNKVGRPKIKIDKENFEDLCKLQCTLFEIASFFKCSEDTIERWCQEVYKENFADIFRQKRGDGKISLRRIQWQHAETSVPMAIFLGKQYLGQKDKVEVDDTRSEDEAYKELSTEELKKLAGE